MRKLKLSLKKEVISDLESVTGGINPLKTRTIPGTCCLDPDPSRQDDTCETRYCETQACHTRQFC
ncbi:MAG: hypothetical protein N4A72_10980 [Bacteroidales bacterium]|jgi:hypothetical protein|nr:hypothetical protein [Bacteroidales bacterium]